MPLQLSDQQCFVVTILVFIVLGFIRGWRRELVSLVFVLLATVVLSQLRPQDLGQFVTRFTSTFSYIVTGSAPAGAASNTFLGPWGPMLLYVLIVVLGYLIGNRVFPRPATPHERFIGIVPAVISGALIIQYLSRFLTNTFTISHAPTGKTELNVPVGVPDPGNYVALIFLIAVIAVIVALIAARAKKASGKK